jgi:2-methylcitrate dehydratase PrpD
MTAAERIAAFACDGAAAIPAAVRERAALHLLDTVGCALAGSALGQGTEPRAALGALGGAPQATVVGLAERLPAPAAAYANGTLAHALDYDDTHPRSICHVSCVAGPAALAVGEATGASGTATLRAFLCGSEVTARLGAAAPGDFHARGFHPTGVCGVFGATVAAGVLYGLDAQALTNAIGIAASFPVGLFEFLGDGSSVKRIHAGAAAQAGVQAALLAREGATGPRTALEGRFGLYAAHLGDPHADALGAELATLGERFEVLETAIKLFPACHWVHSSLAAARDVRAEAGLDGAAPDRVVVRIPESGVPIVLEPRASKLRPRTPYEAKFSLQYSLAAMLLHGRVDLESYTDDAIADEAVLALAGRVGYATLDAAASPFSGGVEIETGGRTLRAEVAHPPGAAENPASADEVLAKFRRNATLALPAERVDALADGLRAIDEAPDLGLLAALAG